MGRSCKIAPFDWQCCPSILIYVRHYNVSLGLIKPDACSHALYCSISLSKGLPTVTHFTRKLSLSTCTARDGVIALSICQSVGGHKKENFERIRNACSFFLQCISIKLKEITCTHFTNKNRTKSCEKQGFCSLSKLSSKAAPQFQYFLLLFTVALYSKYM